MINPNKIISAQITPTYSSTGEVGEIKYTLEGGEKAYLSLPIEEAKAVVKALGLINVGEIK